MQAITDTIHALWRFSWRLGRNKYSCFNHSKTETHLMFFTPEAARGWDVHRSCEDSQELVWLLTQKERNAHKDGRSDVGVHNLLYAFTLNLRPRRVLEVGTHIGVGSVVIGTALKRNGYGRFGDAACQTRLRAEAPFDIIYIDASHTKADAAHDICLSLDLQRDNGFVILHDTGSFSPEMDQTGQGGVRQALWEYSRERPEYPVMFFAHPLWLNPCGAALICKQKLHPAPVKRRRAQTFAA